MVQTNWNHFCPSIIFFCLIEFSFRRLETIFLSYLNFELWTHFWLFYFSLKFAHAAFYHNSILSAAGNFPPLYYHKASDPWWFARAARSWLNKRNDKTERKIKTSGGALRVCKQKSAPGTHVWDSDEPLSTNDTFDGLRSKIVYVDYVLIKLTKIK